MNFKGSHYLEESRINIARGLVRGVEFKHKFGAVPSLSNTATGTVWDVSDTLYPWETWDSSGATTITVDCANPSDVGNNVVLQGLNADYNLIEETIGLASQTGNTSQNSYIRVFRAYFVDGGITNAGNIDVKNGITTVARISAGYGQTLMAIYTVPAGYTAYLIKGTASNGPAEHHSCNMFVRYFGQSNFRVGHAFELTNGQYLYEFATPIPIPAKSDIDVRASQVAGNNKRVTAAFDIILVKD